MRSNATVSSPISASGIIIRSTGVSRFSAAAGNVLGPLQNLLQWNGVHRLVEDAKVRGARVIMGGDPDTAAPGYFQ